MHGKQNVRSSSFANAVERARAGEFLEYWLQRYIQENYAKLGFSEIDGPFDVGVDFTGIYSGRRVAVEAETKAENFVYHRHDRNKVDILIVLADDRAKAVLGMPQEQWRALLPSKIIKVESEDFVASTHEMRKAYARAKQKAREDLPIRFRLAGIGNAFGILWMASSGEHAPEEGTPEWKAFKHARSRTAAEYIDLYHVRISKDSLSAPTFTRIEILANEIIKGRRKFKDLENQERDFVENWIGVFRENWLS